MINKPGWTFSYFSPHTAKLYCEYKLSSAYTKCLMIRGLGGSGSVQWGHSAPRPPFQQNNFRTHTHTHTGDGYTGPSCAFKKGLGGFEDSQTILVSLASSHGVSQPGGVLMKVNISSTDMLPPHRPINQGPSWSISDIRCSGKGRVCQRETVGAETEVGRVVKGC